MCATCGCSSGAKATIVNLETGRVSMMAHDERDHHHHDHEHVHADGTRHSGHDHSHVMASTAIRMITTMSTITFTSRARHAAQPRPQSLARTRPRP